MVEGQCPEPSHSLPLVRERGGEGGGRGRGGKGGGEESVREMRFNMVLRIQSRTIAPAEST